MLPLIFLLAFSSAAGQNSRDIDLTSCRVQLSCGADTGTALDGSNSVHQGRSGKRGPAGIRGPPGPAGFKGSKGEPCDCGSQFQELNNRINDLTEQECPQTKLIFPRKNQIDDWIRVKEPVKDFDKATICAWVTPLSPPSQFTGPLFSYANSVSNNALLINFGSRLNIYVDRTHIYAAITITARTHVCVSISSSDGLVKIFRNGAFHSRLSFPARSRIVGGGTLVVGQEQDEFLGRFDKNDVIAGVVENFMMWYRILDDREITSLYNDICSCPTGHSISFASHQIQLYGKARSLPVNEC